MIRTPSEIMDDDLKIRSDPNDDLESIEKLCANLQQEWRSLCEQQEQGITVSDHQRAQLLTRYQEEGLKQRQIASAIGTAQQHVNRLLRYHRFLTPMGVKVSEHRFRDYWDELRDPTMRSSKSENYAAYEESVFQVITRRIEQGIPPNPPRKLQVVTGADIRKKSKPLVALQKEVTQRYKANVRPILKDLQRLLRADRAKYAPSLIASYAIQLEQELKDIFSLFDLPPQE